MDAVEQDEAATKPAGVPKIRPQWNLFLDYLFSEEISFNGTEAYLKAYPKSTRESARRLASLLLTNVDIQANIAARFAERKVSVDEAVDILSAQARAKPATFYKESLRWTFEPLPTQEIVDEREVVDERVRKAKSKGLEGEEVDDENAVMRTQYQVRCLVIDMEKVLDPKLSHLIKKINDNPRTGISIEMYDAQSANDMVLKALGGYKNTLALTNNQGGPLIPPPDKDADERHNRSLSALADAIRATIHGAGSEEESQLDTAK